MMQLLLSNSTEVLELFRDSQVQVSANRLEKIHKHTPSNVQKLIDQVNLDLKECIRPAGSGALDETMWPWRGKHPAVVYIPRKPKSTGFKVQTIVFLLAYSSRPFAFAFAPELTQHHMKQTEALEWMRKNIKEYPNVDNTCDSWYTSINFMNRHTDIPITGSLHGTAGDGLYELLTHGLKIGQYRVFKKNDILVCAFVDNAIMLTATTNIKVKQRDIDQEIDIDQSIEETPSKKVMISQNGIGTLDKLSKSDLQYILSSMGKSTSNISSLS
jgi:hypothetical protein